MSHGSMRAGRRNLRIVTLELRGGRLYAGADIPRDAPARVHVLVASCSMKPMKTILGMALAGWVAGLLLPLTAAVVTTTIILSVIAAFAGFTLIRGRR